MSQYGCFKLKIILSLSVTVSKHAMLKLFQFSPFLN